MNGFKTRTIFLTEQKRPLESMETEKHGKLKLSLVINNVFYASPRLRSKQNKTITRYPICACFWFLILLQTL